MDAQGEESKKLSEEDLQHLKDLAKCTPNLSKNSRRNAICPDLPPPRQPET